MVDGLHGEIEGHEFNDGLQAAESSADPETRKAMFRDRRINDTSCAEFLQQFTRDFVSALVFSDFLAHDEDCFVAAHLFCHRVAQGVANSCFGECGAFRDGWIGKHS